MNFNLYYLLSNLIPGFVLYIAIIHILNLEMKDIPEIPAIAIAFILGYFVNSIGGWIEKIIFWTWGGEPGIQLLEEKRCGRIKFYEIDKLTYLKKEKKNVSNKKLFQIAMRLSNGNKRVDEMNSSYVFSRSIFVVIIIIYIILFPEYCRNIIFHIASVLIIIMAWYRSKERGFYYAKEVLLCAVNEK